jgi:hypothetical protein
LLGGELLLVAPDAIGQTCGTSRPSLASALGWFSRPLHHHRHG